MPPRLRKLALTTHVLTSVGWAGAVTVFLALAVVGLTGQDARQVRGAYLAMEVATWYVIVPLAFASLLTGIVQSLGTSWGLVRHYWVLAKLLLTVAATALLLLHTQPVGAVADLAATTTLADGDLGGLRIQLVADAAAALAVLLAATGLAVFKPRGLTRYGWRKQQEGASRSTGSGP
ncbi:hypothetical protein [Streptomyces sp. NPDC002851]